MAQWPSKVDVHVYTKKTQRMSTPDPEKKQKSGNKSYITTQTMPMRSRQCVRSGRRRSSRGLQEAKEEARQGGCGLHCGGMHMSEEARWQIQLAHPSIRRRMKGGSEGKGRGGSRDRWRRDSRRRLQTRMGSALDDQHQHHTLPAPIHRCRS